MCTQDEREDCYEARLNIHDVELADSRNYYMYVENDRGSDRHFARLAVRGSYTGKLPTFVYPLTLGYLLYH